MENNIKKKNEFEKVIVISVVCLVSCALLLILSYCLLYRYFKYPFTYDHTPEFIKLSLSSLTIVGILIAAVSTYNFTSYIFKYNDVSKIKYIIGLIISFVVMALIICFLIYGCYRYGTEELVYK